MPASYISFHNSYDNKRTCKADDFILDIFCADYVNLRSYALSSGKKDGMEM